MTPAAKSGIRMKNPSNSAARAAGMASTGRYAENCTGSDCHPAADTPTPGFPESPAQPQASTPLQPPPRCATAAWPRHRHFPDISEK